MCVYIYIYICRLHVLHTYPTAKRHRTHSTNKMFQTKVIIMPPKELMY